MLLKALNFRTKKGDNVGVLKINAFITIMTISHLFSYFWIFESRKN